ncbi:serine/threonine-protein kinase fray2 [Drosophila grimshawi]|uniref:GH21114 n=1 Tax=Drosophila grimshawi TaxID=7222 RepID=B4J606_DROGR|nr:serine/threonine-protein kinase fray2 [Drosophila grimshawi]EDW00849.1 GH21114 [Drosophila grimshawi]
MRERRDRERDRERERDRDRERDRNRDRDRDRERERERERYRSKSKSPSRSSRNRSKSKKKKSKKSKKYYRHSRSSSRSSSLSSQSSSRSSSRSRQSKGREYDSRKSKSRSASQRTTRAPSAESGFRQLNTSSAKSTAPPIKAIDLLDAKVQKSLETIDEDAFKPSAFFSSRDREAHEKDKVIIDLNKETVIVTKPAEVTAPKEDEIFHPNFLGDSELKAEKWLRKLYNYRQKYMQQ